MISTWKRFEILYESGDRIGSTPERTVPDARRRRAAAESACGPVLAMAEALSAPRERFDCVGAHPALARPTSGRGHDDR